MAGAKRPGGGQNSAKAQLKAIGEALKQQQYAEATQQARDVLEADPKNYQALIFLGFALDKCDKLDEAVPVYEEAAGVKPEDPQAWQGLIKVFEKQGSKALPKYKVAALRLAEIFRDADDMYRCQDVVDKFADFARAKGDSRQLVDALELILPGSPIYPALEGRLPPPATTYETLAKLVEADERKRINTLIGERRTRLGARLVDVTVEVKNEVFAQSPLVRLFAEVINWTHDDDLRRSYEEKLLAYRAERVTAFAGEEKARERDEVRTLAKGMVIIKHPYQLAWDIAVDWEDQAEIADWDVGLLWEYRSLFPASGLGKVLSGFLTSDVSPFPEESRRGNEGPGADEQVAEASNEERLALMLDGVAEAKSLLAYRMVALWYQHAEDYVDTVELMRRALKYLEERRRNTGLAFQNTEDAFAVDLATALIYYQTPRNHPEAKRLYERVLSHNATSTPSLIGVGLIYEDELDYDAALSFLERALERDKGDLRVRSEAAWVRTLRGDYEHARDELEACIPLLSEQAHGKGCRQAQSARKLLALTQYRLGVCLWNLDPSAAARKNRKGAYQQFLGALKHDLNLAPAYTSLGVFYLDYAKDRKRAFKCFMKAIELSAVELEAGRRLVQIFADRRDWDSIELVAQRVVDSGQAVPPWGSKKKPHSWPFAALGTAQLHKKEYNKAMMSFRTATRLSLDDYHSFVALAETYLRARMHYSAVRAIEQAQRIEMERGGVVSDGGYDTWFTDYLLGNIYRGVGEHDKAIALYEAILAKRHNEEGVLIALMHAMVESAESCVKTGLFGEAISKATDTLTFAGNVPTATAEATFGFWTAVAGACAVFSAVQGKVTTFPAVLVGALITIGVRPSAGGNDYASASETERGETDEHEEHPAYAYLQDIDRVGTGVVLAQGIFADEEKVGVDLTRCLHATILAYKRALQVTPADDAHMRAVAHYNLGWAEYRAHTCLPVDLRASLNGFLRAAIRCFKRAIELEAGNRKFWNALGVATSAVHPPVAQHAFARSLYLGRGRAAVWANLGTLALLHDDVELANKAFAEGQSSDPDCAASWLGQGYVALRFGEAAEARSLFMHAMDLADASSLAARQQYALSLFDHLVSDEVVGAAGTAGAPAAIDLVRPLIGLEQVRRLRPQELPYAQLFALFRERIHDHASTLRILTEVCAALETDFAATESAEALKRLAVAKADLARAYTAVGAYDDALACSALALKLVGDDRDRGGRRSELPATARGKVALSAHLAAGLSRFYTGDTDGAVAHFEAIWAGDDNEEAAKTKYPDVVCLFAQVLWATGTDDARQRAQDELFGVIEAHPDHIQAILLLGVIAVLQGDEESGEAVTAALAELQDKDTEEDAGAGAGAGTGTGTSKTAEAGFVTASDQARIGAVLHALANPTQEPGTDAARQQSSRSQAQRDIVLHPHLPHGWANLAQDASADDNNEDADADDAYNFVSDMALQLTRRLLPPRGRLGPEDLARACVGTRRPADAQVSIFVAPWLPDGWQALGEALA
ncbi:antiviral protein [Niveomyces insectorum RCEF 264]|uniref:Antiviral protein n=1 Tax=Niveomyces insectorum RCEF 264 TaxID=1081102 RepID=A0A167MMJ4_9HYPO|nr:antiviral protein [Niveomyces insectorum RCEF 264]